MGGCRREGPDSAAASHDDRTRPGRQRTPVRRHTEWNDSHPESHSRRDTDPIVPGHPQERAAVEDRKRGGVARPVLPSEVQDQRQVLRVLHPLPERPRLDPLGIPSHWRRSKPSGRLIRTSADDHSPAVCQPQRRADGIWPGRVPVSGHGRRWRTQRPGTHGPESLESSGRPAEDRR